MKNFVGENLYQKISQELRSFATKERAIVMRRFFRTAKGGYGEGDEFIGASVPDTHSVAKKYSGISLEIVQELLDSKIHEERLLSLLILVEKFRNLDQKGKKEIFDFYISNSQKINNWDLVDLSADKIAGEYLYGKNTKTLQDFAISQNLWQRRIAIISTFNFIKKGKFALAFKIAKILLKDEHDLIHKAVGWMLREIGKRDIAAEEGFLKKHYKKMPRTMLRYAIEKFPAKKRLSYLKGQI